jgi:putative copper resistance protein D
MLTALLIIARTMQIAASLLLAGIFTFDLISVGITSGRPADAAFREAERSLFYLAKWTLVAALLSALLWFWLEVANMTGLRLTDAFTATAWRTVFFETEFGRVWQVRLGLIVVAFVLVTGALAQHEARRALILVLWLVSVVFLVSLAWISHAAAARPQPLGLLGDAVHLCAAGGWIGGMAPLTIFLARAHGSLSLGQEAARVLQRFSVLSLCCVSVLVVSGISNSWLLVGSIHALFTTPYGWLLLLKLVLFGILLGFGARNRLVLKTAKPLINPANSDALLQLRRNMIREICLGVAVVTFVACLGVTPPARHG